MIRTALATAAASALVFHLGGCQRGPAAPTDGAAASTFVDGSATRASAGNIDTGTAPGAGASATSFSDPGFVQLLYSRDPMRVTDALIATIEAREWQRLRAFWGDRGERSGLTPQAFAKRWDRLSSPVVTTGEARMEGAAGSLFYTVPVTIDDGARTISGEIVLRRANDVPGATREQLRWHVESTTIEP
ncbi:hypothetical protein SAMN06272759_10719 [Novosphingobium sp. B1]|nr:hypothetical protein SAMN06272759_10719 [Novosphingobium sp. B1]